MTAIEFIAASYGTKTITGTDAVTGKFAGFMALEDTVIDAMKINDVSATPETQLGSANIAAGQLVTINGYLNNINCTSITLTSGSLVAINGN